MQPLVSFQPVKINNFELTIYNFDNLSLITTFLRNGPNLGAQNEDVFTAIYIVSIHNIQYFDFLCICLDVNPKRYDSNWFEFICLYCFQVISTRSYVGFSIVFMQIIFERNLKQD